LGLPVSKGKFTSGGRVLQVVYAGPFASGAEAQAALRAARGNGFSDAFIR
jgi:SPOR domain